jgi:hypothetical protein
MIRSCFAHAGHTLLTFSEDSVSMRHGVCVMAMNRFRAQTTIFLFASKCSTVLGLQPKGTEDWSWRIYDFIHRGIVNNRLTKTTHVFYIGPCFEGLKNITKASMKMDYSLPGFKSVTPCWWAIHEFSRICLRHRCLQALGVTQSPIGYRGPLP